DREGAGERRLLAGGEPPEGGDVGPTGGGDHAGGRVEGGDDPVLVGRTDLGRGGERPVPGRGEGKGQVTEGAVEAGGGVAHVHVSRQAHLGREVGGAAAGVVDGELDAHGPQ